MCCCLALLVGCGDDAASTGSRDDVAGSGGGTVAGPAAESEDESGDESGTAHRGPLPFGFGEAIVRAGDDVGPAEGIAVDFDRFVDATDGAGAVAPSHVDAWRWVPDTDAENALRQAVTALPHGDDIEVIVLGGRFQLEGAHGHGDTSATSAETTVPVTTIPGSPSSAPDNPVPPAAAVQFTTDLAVAAVSDSGTGSGPEIFDFDGYRSVELPVDLGGDLPTSRAAVSLTFAPDGSVEGGYGPVGVAVAGRSVGVVDVATAVRRLALVRTLAGYPTTTWNPDASSTAPVRIVDAHLVLAWREVTGADGTPSGTFWLVPTWQLGDDAGGVHEVLAVAADDLLWEP